MFFSRRNPRPIGRKKQALRLPFRPILEALEDRITPSTTVTAVSAEGAGNSLRNLVAQADASTAAVGGPIFTINLNAGQTYSLNAALGQLNLSNTAGTTIYIKGAGAQGAAGGGTTLTVTNGNSRIFNVTAGTNVIIEGLQVTGGRSIAGTAPVGITGIPATGITAAGGAMVNNQGNVTLHNDAFTSNSANGNGIGAFPAGGAAVGGAIFTAGGILTLDTVTLQRNQAVGGNGLNAIGATALGGPLAATAGFNGIGGAIASVNTQIIVTNITNIPNVPGTTLPPATPITGAAPLLEMAGNFAKGGDGGNGATGGVTTATGAGGGIGAGGALFIDGGTVNLFAASLSGNEALGGKGGNGATTATGGAGGTGGTAFGGAVVATDAIGAMNLTIVGSDIGPDALGSTLGILNLPAGVTAAAGANVALGGAGGIGGSSTTVGVTGGAGGFGGGAVLPSAVSAPPGAGVGPVAGGGIEWFSFIGTSSLKLVNSTVADDIALGGNGGNAGNGGGATGSGGVGGNAGSATGGGVNIFSAGTNRLTNDTVAFNQAAGGGVGNGGRGGTPVLAGAPGKAATFTNGGGINAVDPAGSTILINDLIGGNTLVNVGTPPVFTLEQQDVNGIFGAPFAFGAGISLSSHNNYIQNLQIPAPPIPFNAFVNSTGTASINSNLIGGLPSFVAGTPTSNNPGFVTTSPTNNGGPTWTIAINVTSPGIDKGDSAQADVGNQDQRGTSRTDGNDMGAFEFVSAAGSVNFSFTGVPSTVPINTTASVTITATVTDPQNNQPLTSGSVTFVLLDSLGNPVVGTTSSPANLNGSGQATGTIPVPSNLPPGTYKIQATYTPQGGNPLGSPGLTSAIVFNSAPDSMTVAPVAAISANSGSQNVAVSATVLSPNGPGGNVPSGLVTFTLVDASNAVLATTSGVVVTNGHTAAATLAVPAGQAAGSYTIKAAFTDASGNFVNANASTPLTINTSATTLVPGLIASVQATGGPLSLPVSAAVTSATGGTVGSGSVTFTAYDANNNQVGAALTLAVTAGATVPGSIQLGNLTAGGNLTIKEVYTDTSGVFGSSNAQTTAIIIGVPAPPPPPPPPPAPPAPPPPASALQLFLDGVAVANALNSPLGINAILGNSQLIADITSAAGGLFNPFFGAGFFSVHNTSSSSSSSSSSSGH